MAKTRTTRRGPAKRKPDRTRQQLLDRAFEEIHHSGFRAASLDAILDSAGCTKGALYHHFGSKTKLGYAVVEERIRPFVEARYRAAVDADDPITAAITIIKEHLAQRSDIALSWGCPFNNLCQEMSPIDEGFRQRLTAILMEWRQALIRGLTKGQEQGLVRKDVDAKAAAAFVVASVEGCIGMAKASRSREFLNAGMQGLIQYLETLRARTAPQHRKSTEIRE